MPRDAQQQAVLTSVAVVVRDGSGCILAGCPDVVQLVSSFADYSVLWSLRKAATCGSPHLQHVFAARVSTQRERDAGFQVAMVAAVEKGDMRVVQWLHEFNPSLQLLPHVLEHVADSGQLEIAQWLHARRRLTCAQVALRKAAKRGDLAMLRWLHTEFPELEFPHWAMGDAAANGHLEVVQWLCQQGAEGFDLAMSSASRRRKVEVVQWLHANYPGHGQQRQVGLP